MNIVFSEVCKIAQDAYGVDTASLGLCKPLLELLATEKP
jgi:hypothetical protein